MTRSELVNLLPYYYIKFSKVYVHEVENQCHKGESINSRYISQMRKRFLFNCKWAQCHIIYEMMMMMPDLLYTINMSQLFFIVLGQRHKRPQILH